jgi:hypothetical protein
MTPPHVNLQELIEQIDADLPDADPVAKIGEARRRASALTDVGDQLVDHYVAQARAGGASWSQIGDALGVSKQAAQQRRSGGQFERFTPRARNVVVLAQDRARRLRHPAVTTDHLLLALVDDERDGVAARVIETLAGPLEAVAEAVNAHLDPGAGAQPMHVPFAADCKRVLDETLDQALGLGHNYIGTEHILLGILKVPDCPAAVVLDGFGVTYDRARDLVAGVLIGFQAGRRAKNSAGS